jgi:hypothetical protein
VTLPATLLRAGENVLAVEVHQINAGSSDIVMGCILTLAGGQTPAFTPSAPNNVAAPLPEFPALRINEVLPLNTAGITDRVGDREPWIEIVNTSAAPVNLDGLSLTDDPADLLKWTFPAGWSIVPGGFLLVFADGEPGETLGAEFHTSFRLPSVPGSPWWVALTRLQGLGAAGIDSLRGSVGASDTTIGRLPDGDPSTSLVLAVPTPNGPNSNVAPPEPPRFTGISINGQGQLSLAWSAINGETYRVEYKNALSDTLWQTLDTVTATGSTATAIDSTLAGRPERYYQVVQLP